MAKIPVYVEGDDLRKVVIAALCFVSVQNQDSESLSRLTEDLLEAGGVPELLAGVARIGEAMMEGGADA